jgi:hypothetical protein
VPLHVWCFKKHTPLATGTSMNENPMPFVKMYGQELKMEDLPLPGVFGICR